MHDIVTLFAALIGGTFALLGILVKSRFDRIEAEKRASKIVKRELLDVVEHFTRSLSRLDRIEKSMVREGKWPDVAHIEKIKWPENSYIFEKECLLHCSPVTVANILRMKLRLRNINIDVEALKRVWLLGKEDLFLDSLNYIQERCRYVRTKSREILMIPDLPDSSNDQKDRMIFYSRHPNTKFS